MLNDNTRSQCQILKFQSPSSSPYSPDLRETTSPAACTNLSASDHLGATYKGALDKPRRPANVKIAGTTFMDAEPDLKKHAAEPIKSLEDIQYVSQYLIDRKRYRDNLLFVAGINLGLRCGDLLQLKVGHFVGEDGAYKEKVVLREQKTGKIREAWLNDAVYDAMDLYLGAQKQVDLNDYVFRGIGNRSKNSNQPMRVDTCEKLLKKIVNEECGLDVHASTHMLRKTFSYHVIMTAPDRSRAVEFLQKILGHSSPAITLAYAGITDSDIKATYQKLNLGGHSVFQGQLKWTQRANVAV